MASQDCTAVILAMEDHPILHFSGKEVVAQAKMVKTSTLLGTFDPVDIHEALQAMFTNNDQLFLMPVKGGNALSLANYSFEELEQILAFKPQCERTHIISDERRQAYESLKASYLASTTAFEKENDLDCLKTLAKSEILEQISNNNLKGFVSYKDSSGKQLLLLENRKVFTADQQKVNAAAARLAKAAQRAALPPTSEGSVNLGLTPSGKPRRRIEDVPEESEHSLDSQEDLQSDSSVSYPCEGTKTSSESEHEDNSPTPVLDSAHQPVTQSQHSQVPQQLSQVPQLSTQAPVVARTKPPVIIGTDFPVIPKKKRVSSKRTKKAASSAKKSSKKSAAVVAEDLNTKMPALDAEDSSRSAKKLSKKKKSRKSKKPKHSKRLFKKGARNQSSSSESDFESEPSEDESSFDSSQSSSSEEVSCFCLFLFFTFDVCPLGLWVHGVICGQPFLKNLK